MNMQRGFTVWFTGLPCSGKTTIADGLAEVLRNKGLRVERLDGDIVRKELTSDLGFSKEDRDENIKRVTFVSKLLTRNGVAVLASFVSPYRRRRDISREEIGDFIEVYVRCPIEVCMERDIKGMYKKALSGEISNFTGVDDVYEEPLNPEIIVDTDKDSVSDSVQKIMDKIRELGYI
jgi:adenylylsulfate kinase